VTIYARSLAAAVGQPSRNDLPGPLRAYRHQTPRPHVPAHPLDYPCGICMAIALHPCRDRDGTFMGGYHPVREKAASRDGTP
jgi:hypothetical protein